MSSWSENRIYNLIPQEEYELAFDMVNGKSISCVLNLEEEIDYSKIEHVQEILELTLMDILKSEDVNEKDVAEVSQKIYLLLSALPFLCCFVFLVVLVCSGFFVSTFLCER